MKTQLTFEQAFYGNDRSGYQMLGNSNPAYSGAIERICCSIGTPDGFSEVSPFLISTASGGMLVMICCRMGAPDSSNRKTLFFHALYASRILCENASVDAFRLFRAGKFAEKPEPDCKQVTIELEPDTGKHGSPPFSWDGEKLALICKAPANDRVESLLGDKANRVSWASFTFAPLSAFKLYAVSKYVSTPDDRVCRDADGKVLFQPNTQKHQQTMSSNQRQEKNSVPPGKKNPAASILGILLVISMALNVLFFAKPGLLIGAAPQSANNTSAQEHSATEPSADFLLELRSKFATENIIDWEKESLKKENRAFFSILENPDQFDKNKSIYPFYTRIEYYVKFLNQHMLSQTKETSK